MITGYIGETLHRIEGNTEERIENVSIIRRDYTPVSHLHLRINDWRDEDIVRHSK